MHHNLHGPNRNHFLPLIARGLIIPAVIRRLHVSSLQAGENILSPEEAHHLRNVLRLQVGDEVEIFDDGGQVAGGRITVCDAGRVAVLAEELVKRVGSGITIASAIPKGERADWMVEKLSELGVDRFIPLACEHSVVVPAGKNKLERWWRLAVESAKQSRRAGVMQIGEVSTPDAVIKIGGVTAYGSTGAGAVALHQLLPRAELLLIGPEGGWSDAELQQFQQCNCIGVRLTTTVLRVETAAVVGAALLACMPS